jgi:hypothetical protein
MGRNVRRQPNNHKISNRMTNTQMPTRAMVFPFGMLYRPCAVAALLQKSHTDWNSTMRRLRSTK